MPISRILSLCEDCEPFDVAMCSGCIRRTSIKVTKPRAADQQQAVAVDLDQESEAFSAAGPIVPEQYVEQTPMGGPQQDQFAGFVEGDGDVDLDDVLADAVAYTPDESMSGFGANASVQPTRTHKNKGGINRRTRRATEKFYADEISAATSLAKAGSTDGAIVPEEYTESEGAAAGTAGVIVPEEYMGSDAPGGAAAVIVPEEYMGSDTPGGGGGAVVVPDEYADSSQIAVVNQGGLPFKLKRVRIAKEPSRPLGLSLVGPDGGPGDDRVGVFVSVVHAAGPCEGLLQPKQRVVRIAGRDVQRSTKAACDGLLASAPAGELELDVSVEPDIDGYMAFYNAPSQGQPQQNPASRSAPRPTATAQATTSAAPGRERSRRSSSTTGTEYDDLGRLQLCKMCKERGLEYKQFARDIAYLRRLLVESDSGKHGTPAADYGKLLQNTPAVKRPPTAAAGAGSAQAAGAADSEYNLTGDEHQYNLIADADLNTAPAKKHEFAARTKAGDTTC